MQLFESKLTKGARLLWQRAVAFSPRRSGGTVHIYADVIRVWSVVADHDRLHRAVVQVARSIARGRCLGRPI